MVETKMLNVNGMSCGHCEKAVKESVGGLAGVDKVTVDLEANKVEVKYDTAQVNLNTITETIKEQGYDVM